MIHRLELHKQLFPESLTCSGVTFSLSSLTRQLWSDVSIQFHRCLLLSHRWCQKIFLSNFRYQMVALIAWNLWLSPCAANRTWGLAAFDLLFLVCTYCSSVWATQESQCVLGWDGHTKTMILEVAGVRHSSALLLAEQFPVLSPIGRIYLTDLQLPTYSFCYPVYLWKR